MIIPKIMGIVNVTPDSFSDGGKFLESKAAIEHGYALIKEGADILDIGGESTRPFAAPVCPEDEIARILPVIKEFIAAGIKISVDTRHAETMRTALEAGVSFINDINALRGEGALKAVAETKADVCLMHMQGAPKTMQKNPQYGNVVSEVFDFLMERVTVCEQAGISKDRIHADIGVGFGKTLEQNLALIKNLSEFKKLGVKLLLGTSRKKFIEAIAGDAPPHDRLGGSIATALYGMDAGIDIIRVHDVRQTRQALAIWSSLKA